MSVNQKSSHKPRKHRPKSNKEDEESKEKFWFSHGFFRNGFVFEQVKHGLFANGETDELVEEYTITTKDFTDKTFKPSSKVAWRLVEKPLHHKDQEEIYKEIKQFIQDHLFLPDKELYDVLTAWVMATWIWEIWEAVPYIFFYGVKSTGKTRGLEVLQALCYRGILASNVSPAALYRVCDLWHPTILLDETEIYSQEAKSEVLHLLNSGYRKGVPAIRVRKSEEGYGIELFDVFGFKALAGTRNLIPTLESRSIMIRMLKARRSVRKRVDWKTAEVLRSKLLNWRINSLGCGELSELSELFSRHTPTLNLKDGRLEELFDPLLAVSNNGRENIMKYAERTKEIMLFEEKATVEAELVEILVKTELLNEKNVVLTKDLTNEFNSTRSDKEKWKTRTIGRVIRRLGFNKIHTKKGNGWLINKDRLQYLQETYGLIHLTLGDSSPSSPSSPLILNPMSPGEPAEKCELCGMFPVAFKFMVDEQEVRRCRQCVEKMKSGDLKFKFTALTKTKEI